MAGYNEEVKDAMVLRSLDLLVNSWTNDNLTEDDMADQLEAVNHIVDGTLTFDQFLDVTNLHGREKLN